MAKRLSKVLLESKSDLAMERSNLAMTKVNMVMVRGDLELESQKRDAKEVATKEKLKQEVDVIIEKYKVSIDFVVDMARAMADIRASKEFFYACITFDHEAFIKATN